MKPAQKRTLPRGRMNRTYGFVLSAYSYLSSTGLLVGPRLQLAFQLHQRRVQALGRQAMEQ